MLARLTETPASLAAAGLVLVAVAGATVAFLAARAGSVVVAYLGSGVLGVATIVLVRAVWRAHQAAERLRSLLARALEASTDPQVIVGADGAAVLYNPLFRDLAEGQAPLAALERACEGTTGRLELRRLDAAARAGTPGAAEFAMSGPAFGIQGGPVLARVEARPLSGWSGHVHWRIAAPPPPAAAPTPAATVAPDLDEAPVGALAVAEDGRITYANETVAGWLGGSVEQLAGGALHLHELLEAPPVGAALFALAPGAGDEALTVRLALPGGTAQPYLVRQRFRREGARILGAALFLLPAPTPLQAAVPPTVPPTVPSPAPAETAVVVALQESLRRMESFFNEAPFGVALFDATLHLLQCNNTFRRMAGGTDPVGRAFADLVDRNRAGPFAERLAELVAGGEPPLPAELRFAGEGVTAQLYASRVALDGPDGTAAGIVLHAVDMTDQKNLEAQFVQSQKMQAIGQLAGGVAHDFNNLLTAMIGFCDLLLLRHKPGDQSFSDIMQIKQNANRAANLVRQLLAFSRQQTLQPRVLDVADVLSELSHLLRRLIGENIEFKMLHGRDLGLVKVDQGQLEQVIINMVVNARDAMPDGGRLTISTRNFETPAAVRWGSEEMPPGRYVVVEVSDTGIGIAKEDLQRIFEPFFSTKEVGAGTGLGLSTVYGIVRQTGGFVFVDSEVGEGARFAVYLPRHEEAATPEPAAAAEARDRAPSDLTGAGTILLVEDEDAVRVFSARALRNKGYQVLEARTGEAALAMLSDGAREVDLLVTDVVMPEMDGPTLVRNLRPLRPNLKVIFISGYTEDRFRGTLEEDVPIEFLAKPFSLKQLASKVKEVLGKE